MTPQTDQKLASFLWGDLGHSGHACQIYSTESELIDTLTGFAGGALWNGDAVIVVATNAHSTALEACLRESGLDLGFLRAADRFIGVSAESLLRQIIGDDGWPEEARFRAAVDPLVGRAARGGRRVRVYGEMVAILWAQGLYESAVRLEHLWNRYLDGRGVPLLCAYPRQGFKAGGAAAVNAVEKAHSLFIS
jgi:hypothetical protein